VVLAVLGELPKDAAHGTEIGQERQVVDCMTGAEAIGLLKVRKAEFKK
jgi:hypothetical protein